MSTYSSLIKSSNAFVKLFKALGKVFLVMTIIFFILACFMLKRYSSDFPPGLLQHYAGCIYFMSPAIITLVLSVASFVAAKCAYNIRLELPAESEKK